MERPRAQANVLGRIGAIAGFYGIDLDPLFKPLSLLGTELTDRAMVTVPHTFDRIAIATRGARDRVSAVLDTAQSRRVDRLMPGIAELEVELESDGDRIATTARALQTRSLEVLCGDLETLGAATTALDRLRRAVQRLGDVPQAIADRHDADGGLRWTLQFRHRNDSDVARADTHARLLDVATELGVTTPQRSIIEGLHPVLAKDADSFALLTLAADDTAPLLSIRWRQVRWETIIRMMLGFYPKLDAGKRLGQLAGAFDAEHAASLELLLGAGEPPGTRVAVAV